MNRNKNRYKANKIYLENIATLLTITLLSIFSSSNTLAMPPVKEYQVELILFKYSNYDDVYKENWPFVELDLPKNYLKVTDKDTATTNATDNEYSRFHNQTYQVSKNLYDIEDDNDFASANNNKYYQLLDESKLKYKQAYTNIKNNSRYNVIAHIGWLQPKKDILNSKPVYFEAGNFYQSISSDIVKNSDDKNKLQTEHNPETGKTSIHIEKQADVVTELTPEIAGTVQFEAKKFIHGDLNLILTLPVKTSTEFGKQFTILTNNNYNDENLYLQPFQIKEKRRFKNNELNYFDNPVFGAIMIVSEIKPNQSNKS